MPQLVHTKRGKWSPAGILDSTGEPQLLQKFKGYTLIDSGARRGNRTHTVSPPPDFESGASTSSAIRASDPAVYAIAALGRMLKRHAANGLSLRSSFRTHCPKTLGHALRQPVAGARRCRRIMARPTVRGSSLAAGPGR